MMNAQDPLAQLRDIHLPPAVAFWPPAPGWWLVALIVLLALLAAGLWLRRWHTARRYRGFALTALNRLEQNNRSHYLQQLNSLLKQTVIAAGCERHVVSLSGEPWLRFLDQTLDGEQQFSSGVGAVLASGPYAAQTDYDQEALHALAQRWIKHHNKSLAAPC